MALVETAGTMGQEGADIACGEGQPLAFHLHLAALIMVFYAVKKSTCDKCLVVLSAVLWI